MDRPVDNFFAGEGALVGVRLPKVAPLLSGPYVAIDYLTVSFCENCDFCENDSTLPKTFFLTNLNCVALLNGICLAAINSFLFLFRDRCY